MEKNLDPYIYVGGFIAFLLFCAIMDYNGADRKVDRERQGKIQDRMEQTL